MHSVHAFYAFYALLAVRIQMQFGLFRQQQPQHQLFQQQQHVIPQLVLQDHALEKEKDH